MAYYGLTDTVFGSMLIAVEGERTIALRSSSVRTMGCLAG